MAPLHVLPLSPRIGGQVNNNRSNVGQYLTREQANFVYRKTESVEMINNEMLQQGLEQEKN